MYLLHHYFAAWEKKTKREIRVVVVTTVVEAITKLLASVARYRIASGALWQKKSKENKQRGERQKGKIITEKKKQL